MVLVQLPISMVATALPEKLATARASDMNRSIPTITTDAVEQFRAVALQAAGQDGQARAADTRGALRGDDHERQQRDLLGSESGMPMRRR